MLAQRISRLKADPADARNQADLGVALVQAGNVAGLQEMFNFLHQSGQGGMQCAYMIGQGLAHRESDLLKRLVRRYDRNCPFRGPLVAWLGCAHALDYELDEAVAALREGLRWVCLTQEHFPQERLAPLRYRQLVKSAFLFERSDWAGAGPVATPSLETLHPGRPDGDFACLAAADSRYFVTYAPGLLADLQARVGAAATPVLVIIDPDSKALSLAAELALRHPNAVILASSYGGAKLVEYCTGARFVLAGDILRRLNRPTVILDIDSSVPPGCADVFATITELPLSSLHRHVAPPFLIAEACVVGVHPGENSDRFLADLTRYFLAKLAEDGPLWHVDQVALHHAIARARRRGVWPTDLGRVFHGAIELPDYFKKPHELDYGHRVQIRTDGIADQPHTVTADGKPVFSPPARGA